MTPTDVSAPDLVAMMLADARLPSGGHTQSGGLEAAVRAGLADDGRRLADVVDYARGRLATVVRVEAGTAVVARAVVAGGGSWPDLVTVEAQWAARTPSQALRAVSRRQGRAALRMAGRVWPGVLEHLPRDAEVPRPVVLGVVAAVTGLDGARTARVVGYDDAQTVVAAALKLLPVDPIEAAGWVVALHPDIEAVVDAVADLVEPDRIPADGAPLVDLLAQQHAHERMRLFHA